MKLAQRFLAVAVIAGACFISIGCETTKGAGKDIETAGEKMQDAADRNK